MMRRLPSISGAKNAPGGFVAFTAAPTRAYSTYLGRIHRRLPSRTRYRDTLLVSYINVSLITRPRIKRAAG